MQAPNYSCVPYSWPCASNFCYALHRTIAPWGGDTWVHIHRWLLQWQDQLPPSQCLPSFAAPHAREKAQSLPHTPRTTSRTLCQAWFEFTSTFEARLGCHSSYQHINNHDQAHWQKRSKFTFPVKNDCLNGIQTNIIKTDTIKEERTHDKQA